jgi:hypothetical protein
MLDLGQTENAPSRVGGTFVPPHPVWYNRTQKRMSDRASTSSRIATDLGRSSYARFYAWRFS